MSDFSLAAFTNLDTDTVKMDSWVLPGLEFCQVDVMESKRVVLICSGCYNRISLAGWLKP